MSIVNPAQLTWNGEEIKTLGEAILEQAFSNPEIKQIMTVVEPIVAKKQIALIGLMGLVGTKGAGCVENIDGEPTVAMSEKFWDPEDVEIHLTQCAKDLDESFFVWAMNKGLRRADLTDTDFATFIEERLGIATNDAIWRISWFGDTAIDNAPVGTLKAGVNVKYFNIIDGFWKQLFAIGVANPARRYAIPENALLTKAAQDALAADRALRVFESLKYNADYRLRAGGTAVILATQSLVDNYAAYLRSQGNEASFLRIESGYTVLMFEGTMIIPINFWDRTIRSYFDDGTVYNLPHRALFIEPTNLQLGTDSQAALGEFDVWFDKKDKKNHMEARFMLDAKVIEDFKVQMAY